MESNIYIDEMSVTLFEKLTLSEVIEKYGDYMTEKEIQLLKLNKMKDKESFIITLPEDIRQDIENNLNKIKEMENKYTLDKPENTVFCSTNTPEVQEFIELSSIKVETDNIDEQTTTEPSWVEL